MSNNLFLFADIIFIFLPGAATQNLGRVETHSGAAAIESRGGTPDQDGRMKSCSMFGKLCLSSVLASEDLSMTSANILLHKRTWSHPEAHLARFVNIWQEALLAGLDTL